MFLKSIFSERVKSLRTAKKISLSEFGEVFGISKQSAQRWETGVNIPSAENLVKIANYFDVSLDYLVGRTDKPEVNK